MMRKRFFRAATVILALGAAGSAQAISITPAVEYQTADLPASTNQFTLGYSFSLSASTAINALGYFADGRTSDHRVGIWDSTGALLASTTVLGTDPIIGHFRWNAINLTLAAGDYVIGGEFLGVTMDLFPEFAQGVTTIPQFTWGKDLQINAGGLNFPTLSLNGGYGQNGILLANFSVGDAAVPEPASWALMIAGFGMVGFAMRRRATAVAA
jgi:hypothetical protein